MNAIRANNVGLKYQRFNHKVAKIQVLQKRNLQTQFLYDRIYHALSDKAFIGHLK